MLALSFSLTIALALSSTAPGAADADEAQDGVKALAIPAASAGGAVAGYFAGFVANVAATNGSNPINSLVQHPGETAFMQAGFAIAPALVFSTTAIGAWMADAQNPFIIGLVAGATTIGAHGAVVLLSPVLRDADPVFGEATIASIVGLTTAAAAAGAGYIDAVAPALADGQDAE